MSQTGDAIFPHAGGTRRFSQPRAVLTATQVDEVLPLLRAVDAALDAGRWVAGYVAFEAAPAFDPAFAVHPPGELPLAWFGVYDACAEGPPLDPPGPVLETGPWRAGIDETAYRAALADIHDHIAAGDTYQVNYTFPLTAAAPDDTDAWFRQLCVAQGTGHAAFLDTGRFHVLSASPELFFSLDGDRLVSRPMKGTRPRGLWPARDRALRDALTASEKDRAENVMIVDMVRNDLGRIADTGSVTVPALFEAERYETVWQMTSTVEGRTRAGLADVFAALFPPASVTGAPKVETMKIIRRLEPAPRGIYCGAVGYAGPDRRAAFNVAIRTVVVDRERRTAAYAVGSGVTHGSEAGSEYRECLDKAAVLSFSRPDFELLESLRWDRGYWLLQEHLDRLEESAAYFSIPFTRAAVRDALLEHGEALGRGSFKVRLTLDRAGRWHIASAPAAKAAPVRLGFAEEPVDRRDLFLYHKTTHREVYAQALAARPDCDDVLLFNREGEVTETCLANVVAVIAGRSWTPPVSCGLLGGTFRRRLVEAGAIEERILTRDDLLRAETVRLMNSVRGWVSVVLVDRPPGA